jgi:uncharacterized protein (TIGR02598 family)
LQVPYSRQYGFSLVEIVLALGIISFVLVAIFGLFPVGYGNAMESRRETRAAYLAEQIINDLRSTPFNNASILYVGSDGVLDALLPLDLSVNGVRALACNGQNAVVREIGETAYADGVSGDDVEFLARVRVNATGFDDLSEVSVEVSAPATAPLSGRSRHSFATLVKARQ